MKGVQYIVDDTGEKKAVIIDLKNWGELWEDFYDIMISKEREKESTVSWDELKAEM